MIRVISDISLYAKATLVRTRLEPVAKAIQHALGTWHRRRTPELSELHLEGVLLPEILGKILKPTSNCIDIGCHIGSFLSLILKYAPDGKHVAIEPVAKKIPWLERRFPEVEIIHAAASDETGSATFVEDHFRPGYSHLGDVGYMIPTVKLDDLFGIKRQVDFIKIDTEGAEIKVLRGARLTVNAWKPVIIFECGSIYDASLDRQALFSFLTDALGYHVFTFGDFLSSKGALTAEAFHQCGVYPFRAFNFLATRR